MNGRCPSRLTAPLRRFRPGGFRVKVAVFMLPLLLPVGQNLSRQPAGADGGPMRADASAEPNPPAEPAVAGPWTRTEDEPGSP